MVKQILLACKASASLCWQEYFEELVQFMTSGPSHILVITKGATGDGIIDEWRQLLGPPSVEQARESEPGRYGNYSNCNIHCFIDF